VIDLKQHQICKLKGKDTAVNILDVYTSWYNVNDLVKKMPFSCNNYI